jgi:hypothetical protein
MKNRYIVPQKRLGVQELVIKPKITDTNGKNFTVKAMIDSGCTHTCINEKTVIQKDIPRVKLPRPITCTNSDGTISGNKPITDFVKVKMEINSHQENIDAVITHLDSADIFVGYDWLTKHNPTINWETGTIKFNRCPPECQTHHQDILLPIHLRQIKTETDDIDLEKETDNTNPEDLPDYIQPFTHLFNKKNFDQLPKRTEWDHQINLTNDAPSEISSKVYNMMPREKEELNKFLDENIASQRIKPSNSPYAAPCFFVPKKDGSLRLCQDYQKLNEISIKDKTPLPLISEVIDQLKDAKYFNKLDIIWGYNNIQIREGDKWKAAFLTNRGLFQPTVMFFGMSNSPATFSRMMTTIFREMLQEGSLVNYMDDFAIPGETKHQLQERTIKFLKIADRHNLYFKQ